MSRTPALPGSVPVRTVLAIGAAVALSLFGDMAMYVILPAQYLNLGLTAIQVGILLSANRWVRLITNTIAERTIRRVGSRIAFPVSLLVGTGLAATYSLAPGFWVLLLLRIAWGVCWSFIRHTGVMTTIRVAGAKSAGRLMGVYVGLVQGGFVAGTFVAGVLFDRVGYRTTFLLAAALSLAALPPALTCSRRTGPDSSTVPRSRHPIVGTNLLLAARGFICALVGAGLVTSTLGFVLRNEFGDTLSVGRFTVGITTLNGVLLASRSLINGAGSPLFGTLIDRHGLDRVQFVAFLIAGAGLLLLANLGSTPLLIPLVIVFFLSSATARLSVEAQAALLGPQPYSALASASDLGSAAGPIIGWVGIELASSGVVFWLGGALFLAGGLLAVIGRKRA